MEPREERLFQAFMEGRLSAPETLKFLARMKGRQDFRERLEFGARAAPTSAWSPECGQRYLRYSPADVQNARLKRRIRRPGWVVFCLFMLILLTAVGMILRKEPPREAKGLGILGRAALLQHLPRPLNPRGQSSGLPRIFELALPEGCQSVALRLRLGGRAIFEHRFFPNDPGVTFEKRRDEGGNKPLTFILATLPFPGPQDLRLQRGQTYDYIARADNGSWCAPVSLALRP